ncbi:MAG: sensor histidine kinase [Lachnospiraceae bacterium]|nr:sensor histidine kinase [Lachnospiraceae bacterium]MDE7238305.1 sensor histidine kinase [Lachnospiraceae bacterium]
MKRFCAYFGVRKKVIRNTLLIVAAAAVTLMLYQVPWGALAYVMAECAGIGLVIMVTDYVSYRRRCLHLEGMLEEISLSIEHLPEPQDGICEAYDGLIRRLFAEKNRIETHWKMSHTDRMEYYTTWVHQIKTPIAAMRLKLGEQDDKETLALSTDLSRIEQYVEMVLCYLRLDAGTTDYCFAYCDLDDILRQAIRRFANFFIGKKLRLVYELVHYQVLTDEKWLLFVIEQVLSNALKYTKEGQISIELKEEVLIIKDTGIGIAAEDLPRIFEKGYTGFNGRRDKKASGIGLYLCKRITTNLGHRIWANSVLGEGTAVCINLHRDNIKHE